MGLRFRKSYKVAPGVRLNVGKKNVGVSIGSKGIHYSANASGKRSTNVNIPGTGLSYTSSPSKTPSPQKATNTGKNMNQSTSTRKNTSNKPKSGSTFWKIVGIIFAACAAIALYAFLWLPAIVIFIKNAVQKDGKPTKPKKIIIAGAIGITSFIIFAFALGNNQSSQKSQMNSPKTEKALETETSTETEVITETTAITETETIATEIQTEPKTELQTEPPVAKPVTYYAADSVNIRSGAGTEYDIIGTLSKSDRIDVQTVNGEWAEVLYNGVIAYVAAEYLSEKMPQTEPSERLVWLPSTGSKYHSKQNCSGMTPARQVTVAEAEGLGYGPCSKCH